MTTKKDKSLNDSNLEICRHHLHHLHLHQTFTHVDLSNTSKMAWEDLSELRHAQNSQSHHNLGFPDGCNGFLRVTSRDELLCHNPSISNHVKI